MFTATQIVFHMIGDYLFQSHTEANKKTSNSKWALLHAIKYSALFLLVGSPLAVLVIFSTHFLIDRFRLIRYVMWLKNWRSMRGKQLTPTGYPEESPAWLSVWLMIIADNILHIIINALAIYFL